MFAGINDHEMYYEDDGAGDPLLFVHDLAGTSASWRLQSGSLAATNRVITFDSRGMGRSACTCASYSVADLAEDVIALMDQLEIETATLVGLSMGGGVVQQCAITQPTRVRSLVLVSTSSDFTDAARARFAAWTAQARAQGMADLAEQFADRWFSPTFRRSHPDLVGLVQEDWRAVDPRIFGVRAAANSQRDLTSRIAEIDCPVLVVGGSLDPANTAARTETLSHLIRGAQVAVLEGASHLVQFEDPAWLNAKIADFVGAPARTTKG